MDTGIRELRDNLSRYIRRVESGERIAVTAHGRVVAELVPPGQVPSPGVQGRLAALVASGAIRPPSDPGTPIEWPDIRLPKGTASALIDLDRGED
jgi:antitoxin (DNA-binding transcriptional repressor) of toxin-antitoxin stability system